MPDTSVLSQWTSCSNPGSAVGCDSCALSQGDGPYPHTSAGRLPGVSASIVTFAAKGNQGPKDANSKAVLSPCDANSNSTCHLVILRWLEVQRDLRDKDSKLKAMLGESNVARPTWMLFTEAAPWRSLDSREPRGKTSAWPHQPWSTSNDIK